MLIRVEWGLTLRLPGGVATLTMSVHLLCSALWVNKPPQGLPWWCVLVGWLLVAATSGVAAFFTMLYGLHYGRASSLRWLISMAVSFVESVFVTQPLKVRTLPQAPALLPSTHPFPTASSLVPGLSFLYLFIQEMDLEHPLWAGPGQEK